MGLAAEVCIQAYTDSVQGKLVPEEVGRPFRGKGGLTEREGLLSETLVQTQTLSEGLWGSPKQAWTVLDSVTQKPLRGHCTRSHELGLETRNKERGLRKETTGEEQNGKKDHQWGRKVAKWAPGDG